MKKLLFLALCISITSALYSQTIDKKWNVGLHGGFSEYSGDLGNGFYKMDFPLFAAGGLSVSRYLTDHLDLNLFATKGVIGYNPAPEEFRDGFSTVTINARFNIIGPHHAVRPYVFLGGGVALFDEDYTVSEKKVDYILPSFGGGINFRLSPSVTLNLNECFLYSNADNRDGVTGNENDMYLTHTIGFTFSFGRKNDADMDGVSDYKDKCADTPAGVTVKNTGCPLDKDGDGVDDYLDLCPEFAGLKEFIGCPDKDDDGIIDKNDDCPDLKGVVSLNGCPDLDAYLIAEKNDPCPDADKDGVTDSDYNCPNDNEASNLIIEGRADNKGEDLFRATF